MERHEMLPNYSKPLSVFLMMFIVFTDIISLNGVYLL